MNKLERARILILTLLVVAIIFSWLPVTSPYSHESYLEVRFLDVGQGDAIHIVTPEGYEVLIDGGVSASVLRELAVGRSFFDREIDLVIATHPDADHVGGLVDVLERYQVANILMVEVEHDTPAAGAFERALKRELGVNVLYAEAGQEIMLGASTSLSVLSPRGDTSNWNSNNASIITQLSYGEIDFMLTGDAPATIENYLADVHGASLESEVLKLGHHGSKTSTSDKFLNSVSPVYAVVSAGSDNRYGHPATEVVNRVEDFGSTIVSTAEVGTITFETDGRELWLVK